MHMFLFNPAYWPVVIPALIGVTLLRGVARAGPGKREPRRRDFIDTLPVDEPTLAKPRRRRRKPADRR